MTVRTPGELATLSECGRRLAGILAEVSAAARPGVATIALDELAERLIRKAGGNPIFKGYRAERRGPPFPASLCTSVNDEVVHAVPRSACILRDGDILGLDIGMRWPASAKASAGGPPGASAKAGLITDMAVTVPVGAISPEAGRLIGATREALEAGIDVVRPGIRMGDLSSTIQAVIESHGFAVVRELVGHGVGRRLHEDPYVPNYGIAGEGITIEEGMVLAVEPMATVGASAVGLGPDGWTWRTKDGSLAAHFEHTILVTRNGAEVLTATERRKPGG